jgi:hypothetical protein
MSMRLGNDVLPTRINDDVCPDFRAEGTAARLRLG